MMNREPTKEEREAFDRWFRSLFTPELRLERAHSEIWEAIVPLRENHPLGGLIDPKVLAAFMNRVADEFRAYDTTLGEP